MKLKPDTKSVKMAFASAKKHPLKENAIVIARFQWLKRNKLISPVDDFLLPNLILKIKGGRIRKVWYSNKLNYLIMKTSYHIQILN